MPTAALLNKNQVIYFPKPWFLPELPLTTWKAFDNLKY